MAIRSKITQAASEQIGGFVEARQPQTTSAVNTGGSTDLSTLIGKTILLPVDRLYVEDNVRQTIKKDEKYEELVQSIREAGVAQNLTAEPTSDGQRAKIISGQRRWFAAQDAGVTKVYVRLVTFESDAQRIWQGFMENDLREDLNAVDIADAFGGMAEKGWSLEKIHAMCGKSRSEQTIQKYLQIAAWSKPAKDFARAHADALPVGYLFNEISKAEHEDQELLIAKLKNHVKQRANVTKEVAKQSKDPAIAEINRQRAQVLKDLLGVKTAVSQKNQGKPIRVTLSFNDSESFDAFTRKIQ